MKNPTHSIDPYKTWEKLNLKLDKLKLPQKEADRARYIALSQLHASPSLWLKWGKDMIKNGKDPFPFIYTPNIGGILLAKKDGKDMEKFIPAQLKPLTIYAEGKLLSLLLNKKKIALQKHIENLVVKKIKGLSNSLTGGTREEDKITLRQAKAFERAHGDTNWVIAKKILASKAKFNYPNLSSWGVVITNKRRILGFGPIPQGGEWITRGKIDCYEMATDGEVKHMLPLAVDVESIKDKPKLHDLFIQQVLKTLEKMNFSFIQFEDFDGESAFRLLDWSVKNLKIPFFNDDIQGTAWILWSAKLAAKARSLLLTNKTNKNLEFRGEPRLLSKAHGHPEHHEPRGTTGQWSELGSYEKDLSDLSENPTVLNKIYDESDAARKYGGLLFRDCLFVFHGGGAAAIGAANFFRDALIALYTKSGLSQKDAQKKIKQQFIITDSAGLLYKGRKVKTLKTLMGGTPGRVPVSTDRKLAEGALAARERRDRTHVNEIEFKDFHLKYDWVNDNSTIIQLIKNKKLYGDKVDLPKSLEIFGSKYLGPNGTIFLIGLSTQPEQFTEEVIKTCIRIKHEADRKFKKSTGGTPGRAPVSAEPALRVSTNGEGKAGQDPLTNKTSPLIIESISNPTKFTEILTREESDKFDSLSPEERKKMLISALTRAYKAAENNLLISTGSPFPSFDNHIVAQLNNLFGFPAVGLAILKIKKLICGKPRLLSKPTGIPSTMNPAGGGVNGARLGDSEKDLGDPSKLKTLNVNSLGSSVALSLVSHLITEERERLLNGGLCPCSTSILKLTPYATEKATSEVLKENKLVSTKIEKKSPLDSQLSPKILQSMLSEALDYLRS